MKNLVMIVRSMVLVLSCLSAFPFLGAVTTVTVTDNTNDLATYLDGFEIPASTTVVWQCTKPVTGAITFLNATTSVLQLDKNLILGQGGTLSGSGRTIDGKGNHIELPANVNWENVTLNLASALTIVGAKGANPQLQATNFKVTATVGARASLTLQDLRFKFSNQDNEPGVCYVPLTLNNVVAEGIGNQPQPAERQLGEIFLQPVLMANRNMLIIQGLVTFTSTTNPKQQQRLAGKDHLDVFLAAKSTLKVSNCALSLASQNEDASCSISMVDKTSTLVLDTCTFDTGSTGVMLERGVVRYAGAVSISGSEFGLGAAIKEVDRTKLDVSVAFDGCITRRVFNDTNGKGLKGFTIPSNTVYEWNVSAKNVVNGVVDFADGTGVLDLKTNLEVASLAIIEGGHVISGPDQGICLTMTSKNSKPFLAGFEIPAGTIVVWADGKSKVTGPITRGDSRAKLRLGADLHLEGAGAVDIPFEANGYTLYRYGKPIVVGINDANYAKYKNGFVIPAGVTYEWAARGPLLGKVTFAHPETSVLILRSDLHVGDGGYFDGRNGGGIKINSNGKSIVLDATPGDRDFFVRGESLLLWSLPT